jgi:hypothetical protein
MSPHLAETGPSAKIKLQRFGKPAPRRRTPEQTADRGRGLLPSTLDAFVVLPDHLQAVWSL